MLSKAMVVGPYQRKAELIATAGDLELTVAVPPLWKDAGVTRRLERAHTRGYDLVSLPIVGAGRFHLHFYPTFGRLVDGLRPCVVHIDEEAYNLASFLALRAARRCGAHAAFFSWQNLLRAYPPPFRWWEASVYRAADGAIAGSWSAEAVLRAKGFAGPVWVVPQFGVDEERFRPGPERPAGAPLRLGYVGRLVAAKGVDLLIDAVAGLDTAWSLAIVGDGPAREPLARQARDLGASDRIRFEAWLPGTAMPGFYRTLDVLVLPSRSTPAWVEQFGRVLIEAMATEVACVGSTSGEIPRVIGDGGMVFAEGDSADLRRCLARLAFDEALRRSLGQAGRRRVLDHFTMERVATDTVAVYRALAAAGAPDPGRGHRQASA
jgi:glycosyltransferase involved in cell wall biosynthesis